MNSQVYKDSISLTKKLEFLSAPISRGCFRGLKRCPSCGQLNGSRSTVCRNINCKLRKDILLSLLPLDPIRLESLDNCKTLYSLRSKEKHANSRDFVLCKSQESEPYIFICYGCGVTTDVDTSPCKHIVACNAKNKETQAQGEVFSISRDVLWNLNGLDDEQKQRLWRIYEDEKNSIPAVQRISNSVFVVRCEVSKMFPAGRLHVTAVKNGTSIKKGIYSCSCKKLKIILEPDNSVVMQEEVCDHILLVLAAVLSNRKGKTAYGHFTSALKTYWMPTNIETPIVDSTQEDALFGLSIDIGGNFDLERSETGQADDIFIFDNEFVTDGTIPDFEDIILNCPSNAANHLQIDNVISSNITSTNEILHPGDPNLGFSYAIAADDVEDIKLCDIPHINEVKTVPSNLSVDQTTTAHLELTDCKIELMDQFEFTDQIDLSTNEFIALKQDQTWPGNAISILEAPMLNSTEQVSNSNAISNVSTTTHTTSYFNSNSLLKSNQVVEAPPIELSTIDMVKKCPTKASELINEVNTRKFPPIPAKRTLIVNDMKMSKRRQINGEAANTDEPSLAYSAWLDYVIELVNESVAVVEKRDVVLTFHVHEEIFSHFCKSFSCGIKLRIPNSTTFVKTGKYKGLIKYVWYLTNASTVRRIFSTKNISLETERIFEYDGEGEFVPYIQKPLIPIKEGKFKRIYPKLSLYKAHIFFESGRNEHKNSFKLEWLPSAFPKSHHGILTLQFSVGVQGPQEIQKSIEGK